MIAHLDEVAAYFSCSPGDLTPDPPRFNIAPGQEVIVRTTARLQKMRWGLIPVGRVNARGRPVMETIINARSETVFEKTAYQGVRRGLVAANGWYEWTGKSRHKTAWRISPRSGGLLAFAAIWDIWSAPDGTELAQVAMVTCEPSADVRDIHHRMGVLLRPDQFFQWLEGDVADLGLIMQPYPDGSLTVDEAVGVDWTGA